MRLFKSKYKKRIKDKINELAQVVTSLEAEKLNEIRDRERWLHIAVMKGNIQHDIDLLKSLLIGK